mmetsp:Transcript_20760/g.39002  ORF Transcript_20760/g.39002 Transcript_20760/m.39002 type:complete len:278 (+) Transcript_20760:651-1484(+)
MPRRSDCAGSWMRSVAIGAGILCWLRPCQAELERRRRTGCVEFPAHPRSAARVFRPQARIVPTALIDLPPWTAIDDPHAAPPQALRPRARCHRCRHAVRQHRRAHQRHRLQGFCAADPGRAVRGGSGRGPPAGRERRPGHRRQHGRGHAGQPGGDGALPEPDGRRARDRPRASDDRFVQMERHRGRAEVHPGQRHRQLDQPQGGRGRVQAPGQAGEALRRGGGGDGLRRAGPGRHLRPQDRDLRAGLPHPRRRGRLPARGHHLRPQHLRDRHRHRGA